jgi:hypothetical protein
MPTDKQRMARLGDPHGQDDWGLEDENDLCDRCGGDGVIMAWEGDGSDWGEDTYSGPMDAVIKCRACNGGGMRR